LGSSGSILAHCWSVNIFSRLIIGLHADQSRRINRANPY